MSDPTRPLDVARADLARRAQEANARDEYQERAVLAHLADVADMVCRIGDHPDSAHYRASKAGPLLDAAINVQRECFKAYAGDADTVATEQMERAHDVLGQVADAVRSVMWSFAARGGEGLDRDGAGELRRAASCWSSWAREVGALAGVEPAPARAAHDRPGLGAGHDVPARHLRR